MKAVISDTSPINYLLRLDEIDVLRELFGQVIVPPAVLAELRHENAPVEVRQWAQHPPPWILESAPQRLLSGLDLDAGETEAISLAAEHSDSLLIIDEWKGRNAALLYGVRITGTLGILEEADRLGLLDFESVVKQLAATSFRLSERALTHILERVRARKRHD